ncbi:hypothetical protein PILCRDRAFT_15094 [Piloderma croceum F 1598]|uniref:Uncharacterized protein n=1 Tax=Piloderma croceum (strain F 1598) TaxID=765440 RepID=A0A0C3ELY0_PILCF|nr:hypothetical protein PILCRDRAFT_15094 [Piloderma croceum F 1598]
MSLILSDVVPDDWGPSWASADLVTDIDPVPPYYGPEDLMLVEGVWRLQQYPAAPDSSVFLARARPVEELPPPGPLFDIPISNLPSPSLSPSQSPNNSWIRSIPTILVAFLSHCSLV